VAAAFVVDSSVVVDMLAPPPTGSPSDSLLRALAWPDPIELFAPDLLLLEAANVLRKLTLRKALTGKAADRSLKRLLQLPIVTVPSGAILEAAWRLRGSMALYDAAYAALAGSLEIPLVTLDRRLARGCAPVKVEAYLVDDPRLEAVLDSLEPPPSE
jgi:predicted nucleic acid-binding protein